MTMLANAVACNSHTQSRMIQDGKMVWDNGKYVMDEGMRPVVIIDDGIKINGIHKLFTDVDLLSMRDYTREAARTAIYPGQGTPLGLMYTALKLAGEAGEVAENVGKAIRDDGLTSPVTGLNENKLTVQLNEFTEERRQKLKRELGDVLWYVSQACREIGETLQSVAILNIEKLAKRATEGTIQGSGSER